MSDLILTLSAVLAVSGVSAIGLLVLPWRTAEAEDSALAWSAVGRLGVDSVAASVGVLRGAGDSRRALVRIAAARPVAALSAARLR